MDRQTADLVSVHELLDSRWHYDCVVSPRLRTDPTSAATSVAGRSRSPSPTPSSTSKRNQRVPSPSVQPCSPPSPRSPSADYSAASATQATSSYVSLSVFLNNGNTCRPNFATLSLSGNQAPRLNDKPTITPPMRTLLSKCREREHKSYIRGDPSRIRSYATWLTVDS
ncbi:hypothetical protein KP509_28G053800 [Ceratopteris richardii]|uniref:Uncharacterized protein n=1 Tax=Ceratopteris richardii TaxID=49495 RepID=A0A8T2RDK0_CERRI|nr:hypothetical protein KP509_28G053800 [Ceratopteris richardii]